MNDTKELPTGGDFLPNTSIGYLRECQENEKDPKASQRLLACILRKNDKSIREIGGILNKRYSTVRGWLVRISNEGIRGRFDRERPGGECKLDNDQIAELKKDLAAGPLTCGFNAYTWTAKMIVKHVEKKFRIQYSQRGMLHLLHRIHFSWRKPRPINPKSASEEEKMQFKEKENRSSYYYSKNGYEIMHCDASGIRIGGNIGKGWFEIGSSARAPFIPNSKTVQIFGALTARGFIYDFYDRANEESFKDFIKKVHRSFGKVVMYVDNASYNKSKLIMEELKKYEGEVILKYIPPYTPELNLIEIQWHIIKKSISNMVFDNVNELINTIDDMMTEDEIEIIKMSELPWR